MSKLFFCDPRRFLHAVEKRRCLYDIGHPDYKDRYAIERTWHELAKEFGLTDVRLAKMRWKNMKDSYIKYKKSYASGGRLASSYRNWRWARYLRFLDPFIYRSGRTFLLKKIASHAVTEGTEESSAEKEDKESIKSGEYLLKKRYSESASEGDGSNEGKDAEDDTEFSDDDPLEPRIDLQVKAQPVLMKSPENVRSDEVEHLFLSYAETFRRLSLRRRLLLKGQLAGLFLRAELEALQERGLATGAELALLQTCFSQDPQ